MNFFTSCYSSESPRNYNLQLHKLLRQTFPDFFKQQNDYDVIRDDDYVTNWRDWDAQVLSCASLDVSCLFSVNVQELLRPQLINGKNYVAQVFYDSLNH